ncbi:hypothetical protein KI387_020628, partial [Taxus chinensis]
EESLDIEHRAPGDPSSKLNTKLTVVGFYIEIQPTKLIFLLNECVKLLVERFFFADCTLGEIKYLNLNINSLRGEILHELGSVPNLSSLQLKNNELSSNIPASIWNLSDNLVELILGFDGLSESIPEPFMANVSFPPLQKLELNNNNLSGESDVKWTSRWDAYLLMVDDWIHGFSIMNSLIIVLFLTGFVAKKVGHGDVFKPPTNAILLCVHVGTGVQ